MGLASWRSAADVRSRLQDDPNSIDAFGLDQRIKQMLSDKGIVRLFDIQAACIPHAMKGMDIVGRARTGCGKTFAFVLPIVDTLIKENLKPVPGGPNVICLLPTRELAKQVSPCGHRQTLFHTCQRWGLPHARRQRAA